MDKAILAASSGLTVTALIVFILGLTVLYKCHEDRNYGSTFWLSGAITALWGAEFILRGWSTIWRDGYMSKKPVAWMLHHEVVLFGQLVLIASGLMFLKILTEEHPSPQGRLWKICAAVVACVIVMGYLKR
jgi:hypothetical protein